MSYPPFTPDPFVDAQAVRDVQQYSYRPSSRTHPCRAQEALGKRAYPCVGLFVFLVPWIQYHSSFTDIVRRLQPSTSNPSPKVLDVGTFINHDLRALHFAGIPRKSLYGLDLVSFWDLGWDLFNDRAKFDIEAQLTLGDILDFSTTSDAARLLDGKMDVVWCSAVLHQFP